jgi:hypothetical protein
MTKGLLSSTFCTCAREVPASLWVSSKGVSILRPRIPPLALISSIANSIPSRKLVPDTAPAPDSSRMAGMYTVDWAKTGVVTPTPATISDARSPERNMGSSLLW